jgi:predicted nucleic acid-binding protein
MKLRIYIETSVISYLTSRPSGNTIIAGHQAATQDLWDMLGKDVEAYVSDLVLQESAKGDEGQAGLRLNVVSGFAVLDIDEEVESLARAIINGKAVPANCPEDAVHVAAAAVNELDVIVTWNFKHLNNPVTKHLIRETVEAAGYRMPEICSPDELIGGIL